MRHSSKRLLITGSSGFLGSSIVRLANEAGWWTRGFDRIPCAGIRCAETLVGDISDTATLRKACEGVSAIIHAAGLAHVFGPQARDPALFNAVNVEGTRCLVAAALARGVSHLVLVSSVSVYGNYPGATCDERVPCQPQGPYAISKWLSEVGATEQVADAPVALTILRFATIYGEGDRGNVAKLIGTLNSGRFIWPGSGRNKKSLIHKEDAASACIRALEHPISGIEVFNVSARPATMREVVLAICQALGRPAPRLEIPTPLLKVAAAFSRGIGDPGQLGRRLQKFTNDDIYDGSKFESTFDFRPTISLSEGMRREVDFLRALKKR